MRRAAFFVQATALLVAAATLARPAHAELPLELVITDSPAAGFHDAEFGEARTAALQSAVDEWTQRLDGLRSITVEASFVELPCSEASVVVARGESAAHVDLRDAAYPIALARTLSSEVPATEADVRLWFNAALGTEACPGSLPWSLASPTGVASGGAHNLDAGAPPGDSESSAQSVPLSRVALHELAHGLGLTTTLDFTQASPTFTGLPDAFSRHVYSLSFEAPLSELDASERLVALTTPRDLVFTGPRTRRAAAQLLARGLPRLELLHRLRAGEAGSLNALENVAEILPPGEFARVEGPLASVAASDLCAGNPPASSFGAILLAEAQILGVRASAAAGRSNRLQALLPVPGLLLQVHDGDDDHFVLQRHVQHSVRKAAQQAASHRVVEDGVDLWAHSYAIDFRQQGHPEAAGDGLPCVLQVPVVLSEKLIFCFLDHSNGIGLHLIELIADVWSLPKELPSLLPTGYEPAALALPLSTPSRLPHPFRAACSPANAPQLRLARPARAVPLR